MYLTLQIRQPEKGGWVTFTSVQISDVNPDFAGARARLLELQKRYQALGVLDPDAEFRITTVIVDPAADLGMPASALVTAAALAAFGGALFLYIGLIKGMI